MKSEALEGGKKKPRLATGLLAILAATSLTLISQLRYTHCNKAGTLPYVPAFHLSLRSHRAGIVWISFSEIGSSRGLTNCQWLFAQDRLIRYAIIMGITTLDLFRSGNSTHARLHEVRTQHDPGNQGRPPDVDSYVDAWSKSIWVSSATGGGASCWNAPDPAWRRPWVLPAGTPYPDTLRLWNDDNPPGHWTWAPTYDMPLSDFKILLGMVTALFKRYP